MAIWFPSINDITTNKAELRKDDRLLVHREGVDYQTPIGDSLDQRYSPQDHTHQPQDHEHTQIDTNKDDIEALQGDMKSHQHVRSNQCGVGPARYEWKYVGGGADPRDGQISIEGNTIKINVIPHEPQATINMASVDGDTFMVDESVGLYRYYYNGNKSAHRKYQWELVGLAEINYITYRQPQSGWYHELSVNNWRRPMQLQLAEGSGVWVVISGLLA